MRSEQAPYRKNALDHQSLVHAPLVTLQSETVEGQYEPPLDQEAKDRFLDLIAQGYTRPEAAKALGYVSGRKFRALCSSKSDYFDPVFAERYERLTAEGGEHDSMLAERVEAAFVERAVRDSDRAAEKVLAARHPRYAFLRPKTFSGQVNIEQVRLYLQRVPDELLDQMIEAAEQKELPPPIIDAT